MSKAIWEMSKEEARRARRKSRRRRERKSAKKFWDKVHHYLKNPPLFPH